MDYHYHGTFNTDMTSIVIIMDSCHDLEQKCLLLRAIVHRGTGQQLETILSVCSASSSVYHVAGRMFKILEEEGAIGSCPLLSPSL